MRKLIILFLLFSFSGIYSQQIVQTYTDRCTGATKVFTVQLGGSTVITFYDRSKVFTSAEFQNGALQTWLEQTYQYWKNLSQCSTNQSNSTNTTNTTSNATSSSNTASKTLLTIIVVHLTLAHQEVLEIAAEEETPVEDLVIQEEDLEIAVVEDLTEVTAVAVTEEETLVAVEMEEDEPV